MIIKIESPLQAELRVGDKLEMNFVSSRWTNFEVISVSHHAGSGAQYTELAFELNAQNVDIPAGTLFRTPYCTWALDRPVMIAQEFMSIPTPVFTVDKKKITARIAELVQWPASSPQDREKLIQNLGSLIINEILAPVIEFAEANLKTNDRNQFYRLTREMFEEEMAQVELSLFPAVWTAVEPTPIVRESDSILYLTKKKINPIATEIIRKVSENLLPAKRIISRQNAPWGI